MELNYLLYEKNIDPKRVRVLVMRHTPKEQKLKRALPWQVERKPELFNAYQQSQYPKVERQLARADYLVSCIGLRAKGALFVGLYIVKGFRPISFHEYWKMPLNGELQELGMTGWSDEGDRQGPVKWFDLELTEIYKEWKGKLILDWPPPEIQWTRWANGNKFGVRAITEESLLVQRVPDWKELQLTWAELRHLPMSWVKDLQQWRGIYFILDMTDGKGYVGSAYGEENIFGRWSNYAASGDGGNKLLRKRAPDNFVFSILERVSPDMPKKDIVHLENTRKDRLHTVKFGLNVT
jgi:hypothetical protein